MGAGRLENGLPSLGQQEQRAYFFTPSNDCAWSAGLFSETSHCQRGESGQDSQSQDSDLKTEVVCRETKKAGNDSGTEDDSDGHSQSGGEGSFRWSGQL